MADIVTSRQFTDGERGITAQKLNDIVGSSTIQPAFYSSKPTAPSADPADIALILKAGAYAQVPISSLAGSATQAQIWDTRLRSFNALGNQNFEVDQRNANTQLSNPSWICDRWALQKSGTMSLLSLAIPNQPVPLPGTSFNISQGKMNLRLATAQASLGAGDYVFAVQFVEGPQWRELSGDVTSISLFVYSDVVLNFSVFIRSPDATKSLCKLCTVPAGVWTLVALPNIPVPTGGNFTTAIGSSGYNIGICLAAGSTFMAPANNTWQNGNFMGAVGMDNWCSKPVNTNFYCTMIQHEPGSVCTTLMDKPFSQNLDECQRYYCKSYRYSTAPGAAQSAGYAVAISSSNNQYPRCGHFFRKILAKTPSCTPYNPSNGTINQCVRCDDGVASAAAIADISEVGFGALNLGSGFGTAGQSVQFHYTADTGM